MDGKRLMLVSTAKDTAVLSLVLTALQTSTFVLSSTFWHPCSNFEMSNDCQLWLHKIYLLCSPHNIIEESIVLRAEEDRTKLWPFPGLCRTRCPGIPVTTCAVKFFCARGLKNNDKKNWKYKNPGTDILQKELFRKSDLHTTIQRHKDRSFSCGKCPWFMIIPLPWTDRILNVWPLDAPTPLDGDCTRHVSALFLFGKRKSFSFWQWILHWAEESCSWCAPVLLLFVVLTPNLCKN